jgi:hypothetical protein
MHNWRWCSAGLLRVHQKMKAFGRWEYCDGLDEEEERSRMEKLYKNNVAQVLHPCGDF